MPCSWSIGDGAPKPDRRDGLVHQLRDRGLELGEELLLRVQRRRPLVAPDDSSRPARRRRRGSSSRRGRRRSHGPLCTVGTVIPPHGRPRREAVPRLPRRPDEGKGAAAAARPGYAGGAVRSDGSGPGRVVQRPPRRRRLWLGWTWRRWTLVSILGLLVLFVIWGALGYLSVSSGVSDANKRLPKSVRPALTPRQRADPLEPDHDPPARHRPLRQRAARPQRRPALRLDHAPAHRPGAPPPRLPLDPARPARDDPRPRRVRRSTRRCRSAGRSSRSRRSTSSLGVSAGQPRRDRRLQPVREAHRRRRRDRRQRAGEHPLEPVRLPVQDAGAQCQQWQGWRFHKGPTAHERAPGADLLAHPREPARPARTDFKRQHNQQQSMQATLTKLASPARSSRCRSAAARC